MKARKRSREEWESLVAEWRASGMSNQAFARKRGLSPTTLSWWRCRLRREAKSALVPVRVVDAGPADVAAGDFRVDLRSGRTLHVPASFDDDALRRLLAVLEDARC